MRAPIISRIGGGHFLSPCKGRVSSGSLQFFFGFSPFILINFDNQHFQAKEIQREQRRKWTEQRILEHGSFQKHGSRTAAHIGQKAAGAYRRVRLSTRRARLGLGVRMDVHLAAARTWRRPKDPARPYKLGYVWLQNLNDIH